MLDVAWLNSAATQTEQAGLEANAAAHTSRPSR